MNLLKDAAARILGQPNLGRLDFLWRRELHSSWGGPFNGQRFRLRVFFDLLHRYGFNAIVETGTYRGTTTSLFAATGLPVYTAEVSPRYHAYSSFRFALHRGPIMLFRGDSRAFMAELVRTPSVPRDKVFFYLDAHWGEDLPLRDEVDIIFREWRNPVVMVDDFQVPATDYGFDSYGPTKALTLEYLQPILTRHEIGIFFPAATSSEETGAKRGSVVLCRESSAEEIAMVSTLRRWTPPA